MRSPASAPPGATPHYTSERAWFDHLRVLSDLPYPSWALMPTIMETVRRHVAGSVVNFIWIDADRLSPLALWVDPINEQAYDSSISSIFATMEVQLPLTTMLESRGRAILAIEDSPDYEQCAMYTHVFAPYGIHWGMSVPLRMGRNGLGIMGIFRAKREQRYTDAEWERWDRVAEILGHLDRGSDNPWHRLPAADFRENSSAMLWLDARGHIAARGAATRNILFLARRTGMGPPDWMRNDWHALPPEIRVVAEAMLAGNEEPAERRISMRLDWGWFDFILEKMPVASADGQSTIGIAIRHQEPADIALARKLWGWPLSPQEKRILIASLRRPSLAQLAETLGLTVGTLKGYINEMKKRFDTESLHDLAKRVFGR